MFDRTLKILDESILETIKHQKILLVGIGGVGGFALESLVRLGFQNITIVDADTIEESNLNRQIISSKENIGKSKVEVAKQRALSINPNINLKTYQIFLIKDNIDTIFDAHYDYIIDACDTITTKFLLIKKAKEIHAKIISCMGTGNRLNPSLITITKLNKTYNDPLAKAMRNILKKNNIPLNIPVIWSSEEPIKIKEKAPGSIILVPAAAGLEITYFILNDLINRI